VGTRATSRGTLHFPVLPDGSPYYLHRCDVMHLPDDPGLERNLAYVAGKAEEKFYEETGSDPPFQGARLVYFDEVESVHDHVGDAINAPDQPFLGFALRAVSSKPTQGQGELLEALVDRHRRPGEMDLPLSRIPATAFPQGHPILKQNGLVRAMRSVQRSPVPAHLPGPWIGAYVYDDPVVPGGYAPGVPLVWIGDSFFAGDTDISSGLCLHLRLVVEFQCRLLGELC